MTGAVRFLTVVPVPGAHRPPSARTLVAFPLVGAALGLVWAGVGAVGLLPAGVLAALVLVVDAVLTGALHLDAVADVADGVASRRPADEAVAVMRDPRVGAVGAVALVLACLLRWSALVPLAGSLLLVAAPVTGRVAMVLLLALLPSRDGSLATAFARSGATVVLAACGLGALLAGLPGPGGLAALAAGSAAAVLYGIWWRARFGPATGDAVGAGGLLAETVALICLAAMECGGTC
jgi:adenosylcobinamide-GDP ribazoletransferase